MPIVDPEITLYLSFADGSAQLVALPPRRAQAEDDPATMRSHDGAPAKLVLRPSALLPRHRRVVPADFVGPTKGDDAARGVSPAVLDVVSAGEPCDIGAFT